MNPFFKENPTETRLFPCPACEEIIALGNVTCRHCGVSIDEETARRMNEGFQNVTDAVASANTFKQSIWLAVLLTVASPIYIFAMQQRNPRLLLVSAAPIGFLAYVLSWRRKYGRLDTRDKDYPESVKAMRIALLIWSAALLIQGAVFWYALASGVLRR